MKLRQGSGVPPPQRRNVPNRGPSWGRKEKCDGGDGREKLIAAAWPLKNELMLINRGVVAGSRRGPSARRARPFRQGQERLVHILWQWYV